MAKFTMLVLDSVSNTTLMAKFTSLVLDSVSDTTKTVKFTIPVLYLVSLTQMVKFPKLDYTFFAYK